MRVSYPPALHRRTLTRRRSSACSRRASLCTTRSCFPAASSSRNSTLTVCIYGTGFSKDILPPLIPILGRVHAHKYPVLPLNFSMPASAKPLSWVGISRNRIILGWSLPQRSLPSSPSVSLLAFAVNASCRIRHLLSFVAHTPNTAKHRLHPCRTPLRFLSFALQYHRFLVL